MPPCRRRTPPRRPALAPCAPAQPRPPPPPLPETNATQPRRPAPQSCRPTRLRHTGQPREHPVAASRRAAPATLRSVSQQHRCSTDAGGTESNHSQKDRIGTIGDVSIQRAPDKTKTATVTMHFGNTVQDSIILRIVKKD
ncbi:hypothetical protein U9M48_033575 [Paspalum notatum var. saurae]|uniref:Uncharacterized protein n=1 Tax=Paspalum notatum var. saurae TaxID=547442 RepID=A0AAQ3U8L8_PASNO